MIKTWTALGAALVVARSTPLHLPSPFQYPVVTTADWSADGRVFWPMTAP